MLAFDVGVGLCVVGDSQDVGREKVGLSRSGKYFVFVVQVESEAPVQSE